MTFLSLKTGFVLGTMLMHGVTSFSVRPVPAKTSALTALALKPNDGSGTEAVDRRNAVTKLVLGTAAAAAAASTFLSPSVAQAADVSVNLTDFCNAARKDVASLIKGAGVNGAEIFNNSGKTVNFCVCNCIDTVCWVAAQNTKVASDCCGTVAASGVQFKVHPNNKKDDQFLVEPGKVCVCDGPGKIRLAS